MKKATILIILQIFIFQINCAQSISESLGGIKTKFEIFSDTIDLKVTDQIVILAAERRSYINADDQAGWGYGYQSVHFEFITKKKLMEIPTVGKNKNKYKLTFSDQDNVILESILIPEYSVDMRINPNISNSSVFYSIDLIDTPVLILDKTKKIDIIKLN
jgi:hypothetical protein